MRAYKLLRWPTFGAFVREEWKLFFCWLCWWRRNLFNDILLHKFDFRAYVEISVSKLPPQSLTLSNVSVGKLSNVRSFWKPKTYLFQMEHVAIWGKFSIEILNQIKIPQKPWLNSFTSDWLQVVAVKNSLTSLFLAFWVHIVWTS